MQFDPNNNVVKLCAEGMKLEGQGKKMKHFNFFKKLGKWLPMISKNSHQRII